MGGTQAGGQLHNGCTELHPQQIALGEKGVETLQAGLVAVIANWGSSAARVPSSRFTASAQIGSPSSRSISALASKKAISKGPSPVAFSRQLAIDCRFAARHRRRRQLLQPLQSRRLRPGGLTGLPLQLAVVLLTQHNDR